MKAVRGSDRVLFHPRRAFGLVALLLGILLLTSAACAPANAREPGALYVLTVDGAINPVVSGYLTRGIDAAEDHGAEAVLIEMDTPGGLDSSMRDIIQGINSSEVPVIVYVSPSGARAASAGTFITMAGHVAAMAPNTSIGAASPVGAGGEDIEGTLGKKVTNDAVAYIRGIAELRGRNADWAEQAVREAVAASENEAVDLNVVDLVARDRADLLSEIDGRTVETTTGTETLRVEDAPVVERDMTFVEGFLYTISDPNIAFLLLTLGMTALFFELLNPGAIVPGVVGGIAILLGLYSVGTLPVNYAGLGLIFLAFGLFALEAFVTSYGALAGGGIVALILGGLLLVSTDQPAFQINVWVIVTTAAIIGAFFGFVVTALLKVRGNQVYTGKESLVGADATATTALAPRGEVQVQGERWTAVLEDGRAAPGDHVTVVGVEGLTLRVRRE